LQKEIIGTRRLVTTSSSSGQLASSSALSSNAGSKPRRLSMPTGEIGASGRAGRPKLFQLFSEASRLSVTEEEETTRGEMAAAECGEVDYQDEDENNNRIQPEKVIVDEVDDQDDDMAHLGEPPHSGKRLSITPVNPLETLDQETMKALDEHLSV